MCSLLVHRSEPVLWVVLYVVSSPLAIRITVAQQSCVRFVGGALMILIDAPPPLPYFRDVTPIGDILQPENIAQA